MTPLATESAPQTPYVALAVGLLLALATLLAVVYLVRSLSKSRRALRACPRCRARAVRHARWEKVSPRLTRVSLECGQCATWRRIVVEKQMWREHKQALERSRRRLARQVRRVEAVRSAAECRAFAELLHAEIGGASDFLAYTRAPARSPRPAAGTD